MHISVIVLSWNSEKYISPCLKSLQELDLGDVHFEIVVVDNGSSDNTVDLVKRDFPKVTVLETGANLGYAEGNNVGIRYALQKTNDFIWIVNPDVYVDKNSLKELLFTAKKFPSGGIFGSKIYFAPGYEFHKDRYTESDLGHVIWFAGGVIDWSNMEGKHRGVDQVDNGQFDIDCTTDFVTGASMFVRRKVFEVVGLLDPKYFLYYEENDFCQRAIKWGWKLIYVAMSKAWHANAQATGIGSSLQDYYITRNRLMFGIKHAPLYTKFLLIKQAVYLYFQGRPWQKRAIMDYLAGKLGAGSYQS
jgi:GT2 family glycosyltransferase